MLPVPPESPAPYTLAFLPLSESPRSLTACARATQRCRLRRARPRSVWTPAIGPWFRHRRRTRALARRKFQACAPPVPTPHSRPSRCLPDTRVPDRSAACGAPCRPAPSPWPSSATDPAASAKNASLPSRPPPNAGLRGTEQPVRRPDGDRDTASAPLPRANTSVTVHCPGLARPRRGEKPAAGNVRHVRHVAASAIGKRSARRYSRSSTLQTVPAGIALPKALRPSTHSTQPGATSVLILHSDPMAFGWFGTLPPKGSISAVRIVSSWVPGSSPRIFGIALQRFVGGIRMRSPVPADVPEFRHVELART